MFGIIIMMKKEKCPICFEVLGSHGCINGHGI